MIGPDFRLRDPAGAPLLEASGFDLFLATRYGPPRRRRRVRMPWRRRLALWLHHLAERLEGDHLG